MRRIVRSPLIVGGRAMARPTALNGFSNQGGLSPCSTPMRGFAAAAAGGPPPIVGGSKVAALGDLLA